MVISGVLFSENRLSLEMESEFDWLEVVYVVLVYDAPRSHGDSQRCILHATVSMVEIPDMTLQQKRKILKTSLNPMIDR